MMLAGVNSFQFSRYLAAKAGKSVVKVKPHDTSQICSCCNRYQEKDLSVRIHECLCGLILDRDWNAAINIKKVGLGIFPTIKRRKRSRKTTTKEAYTVPVGERVGGCHPLIVVSYQ
ncbi:MAG: zinc ribbon domain-containing protein [Coleofasciculus sp. B1-GNL1-01]|uniref:zinc ribbon domain-containing protein n=1 Tax=Coleofasciculus sp. B1-GNL1-01 TaxID=3068484 RepID=UPI0032FDDB65